MSTRQKSPQTDLKFFPGADCVGQINSDNEKTKDLRYSNRFQAPEERSAFREAAFLSWTWHGSPPVRVWLIFVLSSKHLTQPLIGDEEHIS